MANVVSLHEGRHSFVLFYCSGFSTQMGIRSKYVFGKGRGCEMMVITGEVEERSKLRCEKWSEFSGSIETWHMVWRSWKCRKWCWDHKDADSFFFFHRRNLPMTLLLESRSTSRIKECWSWLQFRLNPPINARSKHCTDHILYRQPNREWKPIRQLVTCDRFGFDYYHITPHMTATTHCKLNTAISPFPAATENPIDQTSKWKR